jgi:hypothetical protein
VLQVRQDLESEDIVTRLRAIRRYAKSNNGAPFPPPPTEIPEYAGPALEDWKPADLDEIVVG